MGRSGEGEKREEMAGEEEGMKGSGTGRKSKLKEKKKKKLRTKVTVEIPKKGGKRGDRRPRGNASHPHTQLAMASPPSSPCPPSPLHLPSLDTESSGMGRGSRYLPEEDESERDGSDIWRGGGEAIQERRERGGSQPRGLTE